jgi:hypothetical protein
MAPLYPSFAICAALVLAAVDAPSRAEQASGKLGRWAMGVGLALSALLYWHALHPLLQLPGQKDPISQTRGWQQLAAEVERMRSANGACWIATSSYATTGQLAYELRDKAPVVQINERLRYLHLPSVDAGLLECPALYVDLDRRADGASLDARFRSARPLGSLTRSHAGVPLATYAVYLVQGLDPAALRP